MPSFPPVSPYPRIVSAAQVEAELGPFDELDPIGDRSGSGECWLTRTGSQRSVVKIIVHEHEPGRFDREVEGLARLNSPRVMRVRDHGRMTVLARTFPYLRSEFVPGGSLRERLSTEPPPDDAAIRQFLIDSSAVSRSSTRLGLSIGTSNPRTSSFATVYGTSP